MKWTCNILNVAVGSLLQIPLLSINAVAMRGGGRNAGGEEKERWELPIHGFINLPLLTGNPPEGGWDAAETAKAGKARELQFWLKGNLKTFLLRTKQNTEFILASLFCWCVLYLAAWLLCCLVIEAASSVGPPPPFFVLFCLSIYSLFPHASPVTKHTSLFNFVLAFSFRLKLNKKSQRTNLSFLSLPPSFNPLSSPHPPTPVLC